MSAPTEIRCTACGRATTTADRYCGFCGARLDTENATPTAEITGPHRPHVDRILSTLRTATLGEYDIAGEIGRGGMAVVFLAHDLSLNRKVAIKALLPELLYTEGMDRRFKHEARIAAKLDHPNILVIHGVREANELLFIVMKLVEGLPLSAIVKATGPLPVPVVRLIMRYVAEALAYAHGEGVIHRDVKPANIMVDRRGNVVVMDFGIAKAADDAHLTRTGLVIGTPAYMSPEQCLAQGVSAASDQYSLGVVAYELLTGKTPFRGSPLEMQWAHATAPPPTVRSLRPDCPPDLDALVLRMLAKAPADRWRSLNDVAHMLADDPAIASGARTSLIALASAAPGGRDPTLPTTPASPLPFGGGPAAVVDATTDPVRHSLGTQSAREAVTPVTPNAGAMAGPLLTLSQQRIELVTGDSIELIVELDATEDSPDRGSVTWESSDSAVATVSPDGYVTAMAPGLSEIACTWRGKRAVCVVQVAAAPVVAAQPAISAMSPVVTAPVAASLPDTGRAPAEHAPPRRARPRWLVGVLAAAIVGAVALYRSLGSSGESATPSTSSIPAPPPSVPAPRPADSATIAGSGARTAPATTVDSAPNAARARTPEAPALPKTQGAQPRSVASTTTGASARGAATATQGTGGTPQPPIVPLARPDTTRLSASRGDTAARYDASRPAAPATPPAPTPGNPAPAASPDSSADRLPAPSRDVASALFREFANAVNNRTFSRITGAYTQPSAPDEVKLWQDFLIFVRDYMPRAIVRSTAVDTTTTPPTITASIDFRWATDAGFDRTRSASFVGIGIPIPDGWQLRAVRLTKRFW